MKTILVTGGIGSGKSEVCRYLAEKGYPVYNCDLRAKQIYDEVPGLWDFISSEFDVSDKKELAAKVFSDSEALNRLESILYPELKKDIVSWKNSLRGPLAFIESAIASQKTEFDDIYDHLVLVDAPENVRLERASKRDNADADAIRKRMNFQQFNTDKADFIIDNNSDLGSLQGKINEILSKFV